ncbi:MAG: MBL fold metallo-hydrolase [Halobacteriovoraceae bacterium]|nr:MBL fold metallo-hydrolase [Halobacteriovoraceae bacterium]
MKVHQLFPDSPLRNFNYLIQNSKKEVICIDPLDAQYILDEIEKIGGKLIAIINTHEHDDHIGGNKVLARKTKCKVYAHKDLESKIPKMSHPLEKGDIIDIENGTFLEVLETPGHTYSSICLLLYVNDKPYALFSGDTLFNAGVGNCYHGGNPELLYQTIYRQINELADEIIVYPGHEYLGNNIQFTLDREPGNNDAQKMFDRYKKKLKAEHILTTIGEEKKINSFMRIEQKEVVEGVRKTFQIEDSTELGDKQVFVKLRQLRDKW